MRSVFFLVLGLLVALPSTHGFAAPSDLVLITGVKNSTDSIRPEDVKRLYKGRLTSIQGQTLRPVNAPTGSMERAVFFNRVLNMSEPDYVGYWYVRKSSGQGEPPVVLSSAAELIDYLKSQPAGIGYLPVKPSESLNLPKELKIIKVQ